MKILTGNEFMALLRGLNFWTLKQKIKDYTVQKTSTIQLFHRVDVYGKLSNVDRKMVELYEKYQLRQRSVQYLERWGKKRSTGEMKSHSFVLQFLQFQEVFFAHPISVANDVISIRDITNTVRSVSTESGSGYYAKNLSALEAPATNVIYGIIVGTGINAPANGDYVLQTPIAHGTGSGQFSYQACSVGAAAMLGANVDMVIARILINNSGATITLREIGIYTFLASSNWSFMLTHDAVNQDVNNGEIALVSYDWRTTV